MKFALKDHNKSVNPLAKALLQLGHTPDPNDPDFIIIDHDSPPYYREIIDAYPRAKIVVYPHGEPFAFWFDGMWEPNERTELYLASSKGHAEVMRRYRYPKKIVDIGWYLSEPQAFTPAKKINRVLLAPIHPLGNGFMHPIHRQANIEAMNTLLEMDVSLTVRYLGDLSNNGLWFDESVVYFKGSKDGSINAADLVVSNVGTQFSLNVAAGVPCVAFNQDLPPVGGHSAETILTAQTWDAYREYVRYPYDLKDGYGALVQAAHNEATEWRKTFIGEPLNIDKLGEAISGLFDA